MKSLLSAVPKPSGFTTSLIGGASSLLGDSASSYGNLFNDLNLSPDMVGQFVPVVVDCVKQRRIYCTVCRAYSVLFSVDVLYVLAGALFSLSETIAYVMLATMLAFAAIFYLGTLCRQRKNANAIRATPGVEYVFADN